MRNNKATGDFKRAPPDAGKFSKERYPSHEQGWQKLDTLLSEGAVGKAARRFLLQYSIFSSAACEERAGPLSHLWITLASGKNTAFETRFILRVMSASSKYIKNAGPPSTEDDPEFLSSTGFFGETADLLLASALFNGRLPADGGLRLLKDRRTPPRRVRSFPCAAF